MAKCKRNRNRSKRNFTVKTPTTNRNYKDTIFRMLFSDRKNLLSLYNAVNQSDFIEFYNGSTAISDRTEFRLSSAFEHLSGKPKLELIVTVLNANEGHNAELMQHCSMLKEYAQYVARVRHYASDMPLNEAVKHAVDECIREGILAEFLTQNRNEVISMSIFEYDKELEEKKLRKAEFEAGREAGHEAGFAEGENHAALEIASRMLQSDKFSLDEIANFSGLSIAEVKKLCTDKQ